MEEGRRHPKGKISLHGGMGGGCCPTEPWEAAEGSRAALPNHQLSPGTQPLGKGPFSPLSRSPASRCSRAPKVLAAVGGSEVGPPCHQHFLELASSVPVSQHPREAASSGSLSRS